MVVTLTKAFLGWRYKMTLQDKLLVLNELSATYQRIKSVSSDKKVSTDVEYLLLDKIETIVNGLGI